MLEITRLQDADMSASHRLSANAGWNQVQTDWERLLVLSSDGCFAARTDGELVGTTCVVTYGDELSWIGMVLVDESYQKNGYGTALFERGLEYALDQGIDHIGLDTNSVGEAVSRQFGFRKTATIERWSGDLGSVETPHDATVLSPAQITDLYELDKEHVGVDRSDLLSSLLSGIGVFGIGVYGQPGQLAAYGILRPGKVHPQLGPVVAPDADYLSALLNQVTSILTDPQVIIDTLPEAEIRTRLETHGLAFDCEFSRMAYESNRSLLSDGDVRAVTGVEWG